MTTVPSGEVAAVTSSVSRSISESLASTSIGADAAESSNTVTKGDPTLPSFKATGASFTGVTDTNTVALALPPWPSEIA